MSPTTPGTGSASPANCFPAQIVDGAFGGLADYLGRVASFVAELSTEDYLDRLYSHKRATLDGLYFEAKYRFPPDVFCDVTKREFCERPAPEDPWLKENVQSWMVSGLPAVVTDFLETIRDLEQALHTERQFLGQWRSSDHSGKMDQRNAARRVSKNIEVPLRSCQNAFESVLDFAANDVK